VPTATYRAPYRSAIALVAGATIVRLVLAALVPLFPAVTYYWEWSRHLAAGYVGHPPAIAFLIRGGTSILGTTALGVRIGAVLAGAITSMAMMLLADRLAGSRDTADTSNTGNESSRAGFRAALLMTVIPVALTGFILATPDAPLIAATSLTLVALERALAAAPRSRATLGWWIAAGIALGSALNSSYCAILLPTGVLIALVGRRELRARLIDPAPYVGLIVALVLFAPTIVWNASHRWLLFPVHLRHATAAGHGSIIGREASLLGGQLALVSPILAVLLIIAVVRGWQRTADNRHFVLAVSATAMMAIFVIGAIWTSVEANQPTIALAVALPLLAAIVFRGGAARTWFVAGCVLGGACTLVAALHATTRILPLALQRDPMARAQGWSEMALVVARARDAARSGCSATFIAANRRQDASELAYHLNDHPRVFALNLGRRPDQYDLWPTLYAVARPGDCALLVVNDNASGAAVIRRLHAGDATRVGTAERRWKAQLLDRRALWLVRGIPSSPPSDAMLAPAVRAALDTTARMFVARALQLDSIVHVFRQGPAPYAVPASDSGPPVSNSDRRAAIGARVLDLHGRLMRAQVLSVYRDSRYVECTFVRTRRLAGTDVGYLYAPDGCDLASNASDARVYTERLRGPWFVYAAP
jgi:4-amino-4-deoxy-L-arabinose transferase-like glycosyltransferase